ncbi:MAG: FKBP-type peptidyl-prolyl cis-trans isomerase, partial [Patescibacteria group bacterium]
MGEGREVQSGDNVLIHYTGTLMDGTIFDSSVERDEPLECTIGVGQLIQGWDKGILGLKEGGKRNLTIPFSEAYGD